MRAVFRSLWTLWGLGLGLFALRLHQILFHFDKATGLALSSWSGTAVICVLILSTAGILVTSMSVSRERTRFAGRFAPPEKSLPLMVVGSFALMGGGVLLGLEALSGDRRMSALAAAVLALAAGAGFLILTAVMRRGRAESLLSVLPAAFFAPIWLLALYIPTATDPVLERYWLPVLAGGAVAYSFVLLGGFFREETKCRTFDAVARLTVLLCLAAAGGCVPGSTGVLLLGSAAVLTTFLGLQKE